MTNPATKDNNSNARTPAKPPAKTPYDMLGGDEGVRRLCKAFYRIMDTSDQTRELRALHGEDLSDIEELLGDYLTTWLGGPRIWIEKKGGMCLTGAHAPFKIGPKARDQWLYCMDEALRDIEAPKELQVILKAPLIGIANMIMNSDED
ncbi:group II truncated hemoglobin [Emcibacter nanhaiensis]|uniref:Group II truncated hemoglobin n=1 Tax=Emcibacter nanhaiensis TaxID=1505037 RepID=A0A501PB95_9PROT|nr:group II truncated hemoglobin [Emcibacter nanhaiensis]TPD57361.1 group II truncated hemoglobin [Emcibacter nanhaiensis]